MDFPYHRATPERLTRKRYVVQYVNTMSNYIATVIRTGNSYALRVPKRYVEDAKVKLGQKVDLPLPINLKQQDPEIIQQILKDLQEINAYGRVADPAAWQREQRADRSLPGRS